MNLALSAAAVRVFPGITELKITPLLTGVVANPELSQQLAEKRAAVEERLPFLKPGLAGAGRGIAWLQGPVDKYGLALYLSGRVTGTATLVSSEAAASFWLSIPYGPIEMREAASSSGALGFA